MSFRPYTIEQFTKAVSANKPTPGGGSAAAFTGSLAASLAEMVAGVTIGKPDYVDAEAEMRSIKEQASRLRARLLQLTDEDSSAFDAVSAAFRLPKETDEEKRERSEAIQFALQGAAQIPLETMRACVEVLALGSPLLRRGNRNAASDAAASVYLAGAALRAAALNVRVNLTSIKDQDLCNRYDQAVGKLLEQGAELENSALSHIDERLLS